MKREIVILFAEDDEGHAGLITHNLRRTGIKEKILHFRDGEDVLNFLYRKGDGPHREDGVFYILLLDIRMPRVDGIEVMMQVKNDMELHSIPVIMVSTMEDPVEIERCCRLGCSNYFVKPVEFDQFSRAMGELGNYIKDVIYPEITNGGSGALKKASFGTE